MIELELLGANGDRIVMTDGEGERYTIVVDDALRGAVRRARPTVLTPAAPAPVPGRTVRPRDMQALMRAGATAEETAQATGADIEQVRRFEGPVLAERAWAVEQARACRIGWHKDSPVLGDLVVDRLATRDVDPATLSWDALRHGREPWQIVLTFVQGAEEKRARWELDLSARSVTALDDEARWLTEAAARATTDVFDQDSALLTQLTDPAGGGQAGPATGAAGTPAATDTDVLLASLASHRGQRVETLDPTDPVGSEPQEPGDGVEPEADTPGEVVSMTARAQQRRRATIGHHPAGSRLPQPPSGAEPSQNPTPPQDEEPAGADRAPTPGADSSTTQDPLPQMPAGSPRPKRRSRRSVPSWDEIVFGAKPE